MVSAMKKAKTYTLLLDLIDNTNQTANCKNLDKFSVKDLSVPITIPLPILEKSFNDILMDLLYRNKLEEIYDIVSFKDKNCNYYFGPLNKNKATTLFEKIIHNIIDSPQNINIKLTDSLYLTVNGEEVNLPKLLSEVNFSQIILDQDDITKYAQNEKTIFILEERNRISAYDDDKVKIIRFNKFPTYEEFMQQIKKSNYQNNKDSIDFLNYGEMKAIHTYTSESYIEINSLLRTIESFYSNLELIPNILLDIAITACTVNKLSEKNIAPSLVIREETTFNLEKYIKNLNDERVIKEPAFISATPIYHSDNWFNRQTNGIKILFKNIINGADISPLSIHPNELKYLFLPHTQYKNNRLFTDIFRHFIYSSDNRRNKRLLTCRRVAFLPKGYNNKPF